MTTKLKWRVAPKPVGQYRSFERRGWPTADIGEHMVARIQCDDEYIPSKAKRGDHGPLTIGLLLRRRADPTMKPRWVTLKKKSISLALAKHLAQHYFDRNPQYLPPVPKGKAND